MITNTEVPEVNVVTASGYKYKSFIAPVADAQGGVLQMDSPKIQAIMKQAFYVLDQHELGHVALACTPNQILYLVMSLPEGAVCEEKEAKAMTQNCVQGLLEARRRLRKIIKA